jgi:thiamine-monophosphate kinase
LADLGEVALIRRVAARAGVPAGRDWALGIGDDAAILRPRSGDEVVLSTDVQVEGVHFRFDREAPPSVGRRALIVNLSDLAAMGAEPVGCLLSLAAPPSLTVATFDGLIGGLVAEARRHACPLVGGNLSRASECSLNVTVVGRCRRGRALRRRGLRAGDGLYVTGALGAMALARLRADRTGAPLRRLPTPRIAAGRALARLSGVRVCIDLSDGLASDLRHLLRETGLGAEIDTDALPMPRGFERACRALEADPLALATTGGEDYELLFAMAAESGEMPPSRLTERLGVPVTRIGRVTARGGVRGLPRAPLRHHF